MVNLQIIEQAMDSYKAARTPDQETRADADPQLEILINRIFERSLNARDFGLVIGMALDTYRVDIVNEAIQRSPPNERINLLTGAFARTQDIHLDSVFQDAFLDIVVNWFRETEEPDYAVMCQCLVERQRPEQVARILIKLVAQNDGVSS